MAIYGYCRVSTLKQVSEGESLDVQRRQIEGYALMHALTLAEVLIEEGVSGSVPVEERPIGGALFAKLERGDIVIAAKLDRLFRSALDALKVVESAPRPRCPTKKARRGALLLSPLSHRAYSERRSAPTRSSTRACSEQPIPHLMLRSSVLRSRMPSMQIFPAR
jgi:hypothetical protein